MFYCEKPHTNFLLQTSLMFNLQWKFVIFSIKCQILQNWNRRDDSEKQLINSLYSEKTQTKKQNYILKKTDLYRHVTLSPVSSHCPGPEVTLHFDLMRRCQPIVLSALMWCHQAVIKQQAQLFNQSAASFQSQNLWRGYLGATGERVILPPPISSLLTISLRVLPW